jgi:hypothetical protein
MSDERPGTRVLILVDGPGGVGKTTFCKYLYSKLNCLPDERGLESLATYYHFPTEGIPKTFDTMLHDQIKKMSGFAQTPSDRDHYYVCDRWAASTIVYQGVQSKNADPVKMALNAYEGIFRLFDKVVIVCMNGSDLAIRKSRHLRVIEDVLSSAEKTADISPNDLFVKLLSLSEKSHIPEEYRKLTSRLITALAEKHCDRAEPMLYGPRRTSLGIQPSNLEMDGIVVTDLSSITRHSKKGVVSFAKPGGGHILMVTSFLENHGDVGSMMERLADNVVNLSVYQKRHNSMVIDRGNFASEVKDLLPAQFKVADEPRQSGSVKADAAELESALDRAVAQGADDAIPF